MEEIDVKIENKKVGQLFYEKDKNQYGFNYTENYKPISLIMPYKTSTYIWQYKLHPLFDMNIPEGYLFEIFKKYLTKEYGYIDDVLQNDSEDNFTKIVNAISGVQPKTLALLKLSSKEYIIKTNNEFEDIDSKMLDTWTLSLEEKTIKEIPVEIIRNWSKN